MGRRYRVKLTIARINSRLLNKYQGQTVRLTAKVVNVNGDTATVEASDGGQVSRLELSISHALWSRRVSSHTSVAIPLPSLRPSPIPHSSPVIPQPLPCRY